MGLELLAVLLLGWLPSQAAWLAPYYGPVTRDADSLIGGTLVDLGFIALVAYLLWRDNRPLSWLGFRRPVLLREVFLAAGILPVMGLVRGAGSLFAAAVGLPDWGTDLSSTDASTILGALWAIGLLVSALSEELLFRGYLITRLRDLGVGPVAAVLFSSSLFALGHVYPPARTLLVFLDGVVLGGFFVLWGRLPRLVVAHWALNVVILYGLA